MVDITNIDSLEELDPLDRMEHRMREIQQIRKSSMDRPETILEMVGEMLDDIEEFHEQAQIDMLEENQ